ncbi:hypothetical protein GGR57DRAFT_119943 [Xylariaceae sp. FL1272]|nr:hypothetical protein GGR57DRAFT_119943 [Xylariaceae sp. FL1272]
MAQPQSTLRTTGQKYKAPRPDDDHSGRDIKRRKTTAKNKLAQPNEPEKPPPAFLPPACARSHGAMADAVWPWWATHEGGMYSKDTIAKGMLLCGRTSREDLMLPQVAITTVGGDMKKSGDGKMVRHADQDEEAKYFRYLKNAMDKEMPVGLVAGSKKVGDRLINDLLAVTPEYPYNVMDWFQVTDLWPEHEKPSEDELGFKQWMVRFERIDLSSPAWWFPAGYTADMRHPDEFVCPQATCGTCKKTSKHIYTAGWCCLERTCSRFQRFADPSVNLHALDYSAEFKGERTAWRGQQPGPLIPALPPQIPPAGQYGTEEKCKKAIVCPNCHVASRRINWNGYRCEGSCGFKLPLTVLPVPIEKINRENKTFDKKKKGLRGEIKGAGIESFTSNKIKGYTTDVYYLPQQAVPTTKRQKRNATNKVQTGSKTKDGKPEGSKEFLGYVIHMRPHESTKTRKDGIDDQYQTIDREVAAGDININRNAARCRGSHKEGLTSQFSTNIGAPYKFGVVVENSTSLEEAREPVLEGMSRLHWLSDAGVALVNDDIEENNRDVDHESIAAKHDEYNEVLFLGYHENSQIGMHDDGEAQLGPIVATASYGSPSMMHFKAKGDKAACLTLNLQHGDIVIMNGTDIHAYYLHSVVVEEARGDVQEKSVRRYALTCRWIRPETLKEDLHRRWGVVAKGSKAHKILHGYHGES